MSSLSVRVAIHNPVFYRPADGTLPIIQVQLSGTATVGSASGFIATLNGAVVLMETPPTATLALSHAGGWSPLPSPLDTRFATPAFDCSGELGVGGVFAHVTCTAIYTPIVLISNMLEIVTHPDLTTAGMKLDVELTQAIAGGSFTFAVSVAAGLEVLGGPLSTFAFPRLKLEGNLIPLGESSLRLVSSQPWAPLPGPLASLQLPTLQGELRIKADGAIGFDLTHGFIAPIDVIPKLSLSGLRINVSLLEVRLPAVSLPPPTLPTLNLTGFGLARIGGIDGFGATLWCSADILSQTISLTLYHSGGWAPMPGDLAQFFVTPAFDCSVEMGIGIHLSCDVTLPERTIAEGYFRLVTHPTQPPGSGLALSLQISQSEWGSEPPDLIVTLEGGLELLDSLQPPLQSPPVLGFAGMLVHPGISTLVVTTHKKWQPLTSGPMAGLYVPLLRGELYLDAELQAIWINVTHSPVASLPVVTLEGGPNLLTMFDVRLQLVSTSWYRPAAVGLPELMITFYSDALVGGSGGFTASMAGYIDTASRTIYLTLHHAGGWRPFTGTLSVLFSPQFDGSLTLKASSSGAFESLDLIATATWLQPITPNSYVAFLGHPPNLAIGPSLGVRLLMIAGQPTVYNVSFAGAIKLGDTDATHWPPIIHLRGWMHCVQLACTERTAYLYAEMAHKWRPLDQLLLDITPAAQEVAGDVAGQVAFDAAQEIAGEAAGEVVGEAADHAANQAVAVASRHARSLLVVPRLYGHIELLADGALRGNASHFEPLPTLNFEGLVQLESWMLSLGLYVPVVNGAYDTPMIWLHANGNVNINYEDAQVERRLLLQVSGLIDTARQSISLTVTHTGGWQPFKGTDFSMVPFTTPPMVGEFQIRNCRPADPCTRAEPYLFAKLTVRLQSTFTLIEGLAYISAIDPADGGPAFAVQITQVTQGSPLKFIEAYFNGSTCIHLDAAPRCLDVGLTVEAMYVGSFVITGFVFEGTYTGGDVRIHSNPRANACHLPNCCF